MAIIKGITEWERRQKANFQAAAPKLRGAIATGESKGYDFNDFAQDLFSSLHKATPEVGDATPGAQWAKQALGIMQDLREYRDLRARGTVGDSFQAGIGSIVLADHFARTLPPKSTPNPDGLKKEISDLESWIDTLREHNADTSEAESALAAKQGQVPASEAEWAEPLDEEATRIALRRALAAAAQECASLDAACAGYGAGTEPGSDGFSSPEAKLAIAEQIRNNPKLREISELAGKFRREARKIQANKRNAGPDEISDIESGDEISRMLPSELLLLGDETAKMEFFRRFVEKSLLQYRLTEVEKKGKGPIVVCIDNSGSMRGAPEIWSKAIALALCRIAVDQKRPFAIVHFNSGVCRVDNFSDYRKINPQALLESCAFFAGGGTNFSPALGKAFELIQNGKEHGLKKADVVFITDGDAGSPVHGVVEQKKELGVTVFGVCIGCASETLKGFSDHYTEIGDLSDDNDAKETIFNI